MRTERRKLHTASKQVLDLEKKDTKRIVFHEITKKAATNAYQESKRY